MYKLIVIVLLSALYVSGQHIVDRECPERPVLKNFKLNEYLGRWYEISRYEQFFEKGCDCGFADYTLNDDGSIKVRNCCKRLPNTTVDCTLGKAVLSYPTEVPLEAKISVAFRGEEPSESNYWILDSDYDNYAIVYFCKPLKNDSSKSAEAFWLLSKHKELTAEIKAKTDAYIDQYFERDVLRIVKQSSDICGADE